MPSISALNALCHRLFTSIQHLMSAKKTNKLIYKLKYHIKTICVVVCVSLLILFILFWIWKIHFTLKCFMFFSNCYRTQASIGFTINLLTRHFAIVWVFIGIGDKKKVGDCLKKLILHIQKFTAQRLLWT